MNNAIPDRIIAFLREFPPFNLLDPVTLRQMAEGTTVLYRQPGEIIFQQGEKPARCIYIVKEGAVHLHREEESGETRLVDACDEGDVFGIRPLLAGDEYAFTARVAEESLIYKVSVAGMEDLLFNDPRVARFLMNNLAVGSGKKFRHLQPELFPQSPGHLTAPEFHLQDLLMVDGSRELVYCAPDTSIRQVAEKMSEKNVGSILILDAMRHPLGIVTDKDLRRKVVAGKTSPDAPVQTIMSSPVIAAPRDITAAEAQMRMTRHRIHHLCLTEDGSHESPVAGMVSQHDLMVLQASNPAVLIREILRTTTCEGLRDLRLKAGQLLQRYLAQELAIPFVSGMVREINDALTQRILELCLSELDGEGLLRPGASFCWLALGSAGRGEQLLPTDQDNALVFENVGAEEYDGVKAYYLHLSKKVNEKLAFCGFEYCPADMMAGNPANCLSLEEWKARFSHWIFHPTPEAIMYCSIFFDFRAVYGESRLASGMREHITQSVAGQDVFFGLLAKNALSNPAPLTFFRNFVVESGGEHKDAFDIKSRALMPLADAARLLSLQAGTERFTHTVARFEHLAEVDSQHEELFHMAARAYELLMRTRALQGFKHRDSGRYIHPGELSKMERSILRNAFMPIKDLQTLVRLRFRTDYFGG